MIERHIGKDMIMKYLFTLLFCFEVLSGWAQGGFINSFEPGYPHQLPIVIDTGYHHNIWQVGKPDKVILDSASSLPNVMVTDPLYPYPPDDTSVFILKAPKYIPAYLGSSYMGPIYYLRFKYQLDIDTNAQAKFDVSIDGGRNWLPLKDTLPSFFHWETTGNHDLTRSTSGWEQLEMNIDLWLPDSLADTILFRFTFISGSDTSSKEGWMIDDIDTWYWFESVAHIQNDALISLYPTPTTGNVHIEGSKQKNSGGNICICNIQGKQVYHTDKLPTDGNLRLSLLEGIYTLRYYTDNEYCVKRITIIK